MAMGRRSAEAWRELFEAQARSGMTVREFCAQRGVCARSFQRHRKAQGQDAVIVSTPASAFVRIEAVHASSREVPVPRARLRVGRCEWELSGFGLEELIQVTAALA
jgi:hypothetical protein